VSKSQILGVLILSLCAPAFSLFAEDVPNQDLDRQYQLAVANYDAGRYQEAAAQLEKLLPYATKSSTVHELLGMVYVSLSEPDKAIEQLKVAVELKPDWADARTNFGAALLQSGKSSLASEQFRAALHLEPQNYDANHDLGELYARAGRVADAQPLLQTAYQLHPDAYDNSYDLAMADFLLGRLDDSRHLVDDLVKTQNAAELHNLLAQIDEKEEKYVDAANEYEMAAHLDPTEDNLFDWGSEMLLHGTYEAAIPIFQAAVERFPDSPRLQIGLGLALYSRGKYDEAVTALLKAAALTPADSRCYYFLSKAFDSSPNQADAVIEAFRRYAALEPQNGLAQYYYALSLWQGHRSQASAADLETVESLLTKAISLSDQLPEAYVQLGDIYADQHLYEKSIPEYEHALALNPDLSDAHYRLGTDYVHVGEKDKAQQEFAVYQKLRAEQLAEVEKERAEVKQFVLSAKTPASAQQ
jgi:tetratricopeptide (TPR) repeat protein